MERDWQHAVDGVLAMQEHWEDMVQNRNRWRQRAEKAEARIAELEPLEQRLRDCQRREANHYLSGPTISLGEERRLQARVAELEARDRQWEAAFAAAQNLACHPEADCPPDRSPDQVGALCNTDPRGAAVEVCTRCFREWAGVPEPLTTDKEDDDEPNS